MPQVDSTIYRISRGGIAAGLLTLAKGERK
jgi:hypothetical protein